MYSRLRSEVRCLASSLATSFPYSGAIGIALLLLESSSIRDAMRRELPGALNHREDCEAAGRRLRLLRTLGSNPSSSHHPVLSYLLLKIELRPKSNQESTSSTTVAIIVGKNQVEPSSINA